MGSNIIYDFLGIDLEKGKEVVTEIDEKRKEIATSIAELSEHPKWKVFTDELDRLLKETDRGVDFYSQFPQQAVYDSGMRRSIIIIKSFIENQIKLTEQYGKEKKETNS